MSPHTTFNQSHPRMIRLRRQATQYSFFQAMRDIESVADSMPRLGHALSPAQEAVRISQSANLDFAPTSIEDVYKSSDGLVQLTQRFFGVLGPAGAMPLHMTELVRNRTRQAHDPTLQAFLNIFHHRMALLFYRAWSSSRPAIQRDRPWQDRYATYVGAFSGYGMQAARNRDRFADESKWFFTGRLASIRRNAEGLEAIVGTLLQTEVRLKSFQLRRLPIDPIDRSVLGRQSTVLGRTCVLGRSVSDRQSCFEVRIGPMSYHKFENLLPGKVKRKALDAVVRNYAGLGMTGRIRLALKADEIPKLKLGGNYQIGRNAWLSSKPSTQVAEDCCQAVGWN